MTSYAWGEVVPVFLGGAGLVEMRETYYRTWEEIKSIVTVIDADVQRYNPAVKILHLNYVHPRYLPTGRFERVKGTQYPVVPKQVDRAAIYYGYAASRLWGHDSYSSAPAGMPFAQDEIYFAELGKPLGGSFEEKEGLVRRYYEKGLVVLNPSETDQTADLRSPVMPAQLSGLWDCYAQRVVEGTTVTLAPTPSPLSRRSYPAGRVYLYLREGDTRP